MIRIRTRLVLPWRRRRPRRGTRRLVADLAAVGQLTAPARPSARARVEAALGAELTRELDRRLAVEPPSQRRRARRRLRHAA
jgi:hypothetical protein